MSSDILFDQGKPVWPDVAIGQMNQHVIFRTSLNNLEFKNPAIRITGVTFYKIFINNEFLYYGPSRSPSEVSKVREIDLTKYLDQELNNLISIEVIGHNVNGYGMSYQAPFLQAEIINNSEVVKATSASSKDFISYMPNYKEQKVSRYSFQRPFVEAYALNQNSFDWKTKNDFEFDKEILQEIKEVKLVKDYVPTPDFSIKESLGTCSIGKFTIKPSIQEPYKNRFIDNIGDALLGFKREALTSVLTDEITLIDIIETHELPEMDKSASSLKPKEFSIVSMGENSSGFIRSKVKVLKKSRLYITFDEILSDGNVNHFRLNTGSIIRYDLEPGEYALESLEPYTFQFIQYYLFDGELEIQATSLRNLVCDDVKRVLFKSSDQELNLLFEAGINTFKQNVVDIFMDCPSRERAGWLCDSFFMGRAEIVLTGSNKVEFEFLRNFALAENFKNISDGMLPMNFPGDQFDGRYIPNWAMWFVVELEEYYNRTGDSALVENLKTKVENLMHFFEKYINEFGLLEKLDSWIFIEWSKANEFLQDVNYPSNMCYGETLKAAGRLYQNNDWIAKGQRVKEVVLEKSFNGEFFIDNAIREKGELINTENTTETCQYYAFFFGVVSADSHPKLWNTMVESFGPTRDYDSVYPNVHKSNAFIGSLLRIDLLGQNNLIEKQVNEIKGYYLSMAKKTKTFWEMDDTHASLNHGFASHICFSFIRDVLGIQINYLTKEISWNLKDVPFDNIDLILPIGDETLKINLKNDKDQIYYSHSDVSEYKISVNNISGKALIKL
ncbi:MAG: hypothetical protein COA79_01920 [Planctomycetota bacterium]|nr:MAG: hypothetical protein COA79_01920 [Planctomycetota bacterium]